jgi:hypothetical protein
MPCNWAKKREVIACKVLSCGPMNTMEHKLTTLACHKQANASSTRKLHVKRFKECMTLSLGLASLLCMYGCENSASRRCGNSPLKPPRHVDIYVSGSVGVEVAAKMALQYWYNKGDKKRDILVGFERAYHGDTFKAMELGGEQSYHTLFFPKSSSVSHLNAPSIR